MKFLIEATRFIRTSAADSSWLESTFSIKNFGIRPRTHFVCRLCFNLIDFNYRRRMSTLFGGEEHAKLYALYRPKYPVHLYERILRYLDDNNPQSSRRKLAVDVGCGSGQYTRELAAYFDEVVGVDTSAAQVDEGRKAGSARDNVRYYCSSANELNFISDNSVDLITAATALHWFDVERFYGECLRILKPGGVFAGFSYGSPTVDNPQAEEIFRQYLGETLAGYWAPEVGHVLNRYEDLFDLLQKTFQHSERDDSLKVELTLSVKEFCGFLSSMSSYQEYRKQNPDSPDPLIEFSEKLQNVYGTKSDEKVVRGSLSIFMILGKKIPKSSAL